jgi:hypothetical protein
MSAHNALEELNREAEIEFDGKVFAFGKNADKPSDGTSGFAPACLYLVTDAAADSTNSVTHLFINVGTAASCDFDPITIS